MDIQSVATQTSGAGEAQLAAAPQSILVSGWPHLARSPGESSHATRLWTARVLPDPAICRAKAAGFAGYADCLVESPIQCRHAFSFGFGFFCRHPERNEIVMRTATHAQ
jgi:hypothetical protein